MSEKKTNLLTEVKPEQKRRSLMTELLFTLVRKKPLGLIGAVIIIILLFAGIFAEFLAPYSYREQQLLEAMKPPSAQHLLGTDDLGRDLYSRILYGARISLIVGLSASTVGTALAVAIGVPSGFFGGKYDIVVQRFVDAWMCFPTLFIIITLMAMVGVGLVQTIFVIGITHGIRDSRIARSAVIGIKENIYIQAAAAVGASSRVIFVRHVLPNIMASIIIVFTTVVGSAILSEATISFLGFGIPPPTPSWGGMLSGNARQFMLQAPWLAIFPGFALATAVFGVNMLGDALRDILDPRLRGGVGRYGRQKRKK